MIGKVHLTTVSTHGIITIMNELSYLEEVEHQVQLAHVVEVLVQNLNMTLTTMSANESAASLPSCVVSISLSDLFPCLTTTSYVRPAPHASQWRIARSYGLFKYTVTIERMPRARDILREKQGKLKQYSLSIKLQRFNANLLLCVHQRTPPPAFTSPLPLRLCL